MCVAFIPNSITRTTDTRDAGGTYVMEIVTMYLGGRWYWRQVVALVITAIANVTTSAVLVEDLPHPHKWVQQDGF